MAQYPFDEITNDLPENWQVNDIVSPDGESVNLSRQHGYNYLMQKVNEIGGKTNILREEDKTNKESIEDINTEIENIKDTGVQVADTLPIGSVIHWDSEEPYPSDIYEEVTYNPRQLLVNPDFQVNQRGQTQYVSSTIPVLTVDMWGINLLTVDVLERGIKLTNSDVDRHSIYQKGLNLPKGNYTISVNVLEKTGTHSTQIFEILFYDESGQVRNAKEIESTGLTSVTFNDSVSQIAITVPSNCTLTLEYINLFEGDVAYPHVKNKYVYDLMECQRYYIKRWFNGIIYFKYYNGEELRIECEIPQMSSQPNCNIISSFSLDNTSNGNTLSEVKNIWITDDGSRLDTRVVFERPVHDNCYGVSLLIELSCEPL